MNKTKNKQNKLEKPFYHVDNRKKDPKKGPKSKKTQNRVLSGRKSSKISKIDGSFAEYIDEDYLDWIRTSVGCLICGRVSIPHHVKSRKSHGRLDIPTERNGNLIGGVVALCNDIHHISSAEYGIHRLGNDSFEKMFKVNLQEEAVKLYERYKKEILNAKQ